MANYTGANVVVAADVTKYQPDAFDFGVSLVFISNVIVILSFPIFTLSRTRLKDNTKKVL